MGKPSEAHAKALASLFLSCSSVKKPAKKFNPLDECVAAESDHRKKASTGKRAKKVNVVILKRIPSYIPKGIHRNKLKEDGHIIELPFHRCMTSEETMELITDAFKELGGVKRLQYLQANRNNTLKVHMQQDLDGNGVLNLAGSGSLYVQLIEMGESDDDLPSIELGPQASSSSTTPDSNRRMQLLQRADELIKELRVSCLAALQSLAHALEGQCVCVCVSVCLCVCLCVSVNCKQISHKVWLLSVPNVETCRMSISARHS